MQIWNSNIFCIMFAMLLIFSAMWKSLCCYFYYPKRLFFISAWNLTLNLLKIIKYMLNLKKNKLISHYTCWQPCVRILVEGTSLASHQGPQLRGAGISPQQPSAAFSLYFSQSPALLGTAFLSFSASEDIQPGQEACCWLTQEPARSAQGGWIPLKLIGVFCWLSP